MLFHSKKKIIIQKWVFPSRVLSGIPRQVQRVSCVQKEFIMKKLISNSIPPKMFSPWFKEVASCHETCFIWEIKYIFWLLLFLNILFHLWHLCWTTDWPCKLLLYTTFINALIFKLLTYVCNLESLAKQKLQFDRFLWVWRSMDVPIPIVFRDISTCLWSARLQNI